MRSVKQRYEKAVKLERLKPHPKNPNLGDDETVDESVEQNGWYGAVAAQESSGYVLAGHTRLRVATAKGASSVPVLWLDVTDEEALKILAVDNRANRKGRDDDRALLDLLRDFDGDYAGTGYEADDLAALLKKLEPTAPDSFPAYGEDVETNRCCPKCGYRWSE